MKNSPRRDRSLTMATLSQLAYLTHNFCTLVVSHILKSGCPPFVQEYQTIEFLHAPRLFSFAGELVCCGFVLSTPSEVAIANWKPHLLQALSEYRHRGSEYLIDIFGISR